MYRIAVAYITLCWTVRGNMEHTCWLQNHRTSGVRGHHAVWHVEPAHAVVTACHVTHGRYSCVPMIIQRQKNLDAIARPVEVCSEWTADDHGQSVIAAVYNGGRLCQWRAANFDPYRIDTPEPVTIKFVIGNYFPKWKPEAKFGANLSTGGFWANRWNITLLTFYLFIYKI